MKKTLKKTEIKELNEELSTLYGLNEYFHKKDTVEIVNKDYLLSNKELIFFSHEKKWLPHLKTLLRNNFLKKITVDMGAVKFVVNGADIMKPGITAIEDDIQESNIIAIIDETHSKPLAVGRALGNTETLQQQKKGKSVKNIHWVGDKLWYWKG